jgi:hypothetical protein
MMGPDKNRAGAVSSADDVAATAEMAGAGGLFVLALLGISAVAVAAGGATDKPRKARRKARAR